LKQANFRPAILLSLSLFCTIGKGNYGEGFIWSFYGPYTGVMKVIQLQAVLYSRTVDVDNESDKNTASSIYGIWVLQVDNGSD
jgi:hypothetical protein